MHIISFTGSSETGKKVVASVSIKQFVMELGGGDLAIVLGGVDLDLATERISMGIHSYAGQRCNTIKLVIAEDKIYNKLKEKLVANLSKVVVSDPRDGKIVMGLLIDPEAVDKMLKAVEEATRRGGVILYGGRRLGRTYVEPTLVEVFDKKVLKELRLYKEEVFAPGLQTEEDTD